VDARGALDPGAVPGALRRARREGESVLAVCDAALACLEIVDSVWSDDRFTLEDNTADGSSAAWVAVGPSLPLADLASLPVELSVDGEVVERGTGAAAGGRQPGPNRGWVAAQKSRGPAWGEGEAEPRAGTDLQLLKRPAGHICYSSPGSGHGQRR
jgi:hypothetical protein